MKTVITICVFLFSFILGNAQMTNGLRKDENTSDFIADEIVKAWEKHNSFNLLILNSLSDEYLTDRPSSPGRSVGEQFAHIHETRLNWLTEIAPEVAKNLNPIAADKITIVILRENLTASYNAVKAVLLEGLKEGKLNSYSSHPVNFFTYLVSHESHHRGQILLSLKQSGHEANPQVSYGIWNWQD